MITPKDLKCEYLKNPLAIDTPAPRLSWRLDSEERNQKQKAYRILVSNQQALLLENQGDIWDSGKINQSQSIQVVYEGTSLQSDKRYYWKVIVWDQNGRETHSDIVFWHMGFLKHNEWKANWIGLKNISNYGDELGVKEVGRPVSYLRKSFPIKKHIKRAMIHTTALGIYQLWMNGHKIGKGVYTPGWTDYHKQIQYQSYDVTSLLCEGDNILGAALGDGWYIGHVAIVGRNQYGREPLFLLQMCIEYEDQTVEWIVSDSSWKGNTGPILYSDLQKGEYYDARLDNTGWNNTGYNDEDWQDVLEEEKGYQHLRAQIGPMVEKIMTISPIHMYIKNEHTYIFDMGQNMVGSITLRLTADLGDKIRLRYGEMLTEEGALYTENLRSADQTDYYIARGGGEEFYEPLFTIHGFRYVEVTGIQKSSLSKDSLKAHVIHAATQRTGKFRCSDDQVNQLYNNIVWGQRGNFNTVPTDCPQRDERMGWTGDGQIFAKTACFNMDSGAYFTKWQEDIVDAQRDNGAFTDVAPYVYQQDGSPLVGYGHAAWGDAGIIVPWTLYTVYGDTRVLEKHYEAMKRHVEFLKKNSKNYLRNEDIYGDWLSVGEETPKDVMATAFYAYCVKLMENISLILHKSKEQIEYNTLFNRIKNAFCLNFIDELGKIKGDTQTGYVLALRFDLLPQENRQKVAYHLVNNIKRRDGHLTTGFVGVSYLLPVLTEAGYVEVAYELLRKDTYPSWLYSIKNGATTIWERWNSYTLEDGFGDVGMNSFNHYSLGSVGQWMYEYMAGIIMDESWASSGHVIIKPWIYDKIDFVEAEYDSIRGKIGAKWKKEGKRLMLNVIIPPNTTATIYIPAGQSDLITEQGNELVQYRDIQLIGWEKGFCVVKISSGKYQFVVTEERL